MRRVPVSSVVAKDFLAQFKGSFTSALRWPQFDALWAWLAEHAEGWYVYQVGQAPPTAPAEASQLNTFLVELDALLKREHDEDYCGIVYADDLAAPGMIKIYDPNNLGVVCGYSDNPPLPGWVLSRIPPVDLGVALQPAARKRWWQKIFS